MYVLIDHYDWMIMVNHDTSDYWERLSAIASVASSMCHDHQMNSYVLTSVFDSVIM